LEVKFYIMRGGGNGIQVIDQKIRCGVIRPLAPAPAAAPAPAVVK
jgi:hypothetical protein